MHMGLKECWNGKDDKARGSVLHKLPAQVQKLFPASDWHSNNSTTRQALWWNSTAKEHADLCGPADMSIQWFYLKQSVLCYTVSVSTLFSWAGRLCLALSVLIFQLLFIFMPLSCLMGAQNTACSEVPPKLWIQLSLCPWRCREDSLESFPGAAVSDSVDPTWISSCPCHARALPAPVPASAPVQSSQGQLDSREEVIGEEV